MKSILRTIWSFILPFIIAAIIFCLLIIFVWKWKSKSNDQINTYTVHTWTIEDTIQVYGNAELKNEDTLWFSLQWDVAWIYIKQWDYVSKWQVLATLDTENLDNEIKQAEINLENAKINYQDLEKWGTESQILQAENNLAQSRLALELAQDQYDELVKSSKIDTVSNSNESTLKSATINIKDFITQWEKAIIAIDKIFGVSSKYENENSQYQPYLSKKNTSYKKQTQRLISQCYNLLDELKDEYENIDNSPTIDDKNDIIDTLESAEEFYEKLYDTTEKGQKALENSETNDILTASILWNFENTVTNYNTLAKTTLSNIVNLTNWIKNLSKSNNNDLSIQAKKNEIENLENTIRLQEQSLQDIKKWWTDSQKEIAANNIKQSELTVDKAKKSIENYQIIAPFDWIIRKIDFEIWDKITSTNPKYIYIENPDLIEITLLLDQIDIVQVSKWMPAEIEFDAYPEIIFTWIIDDIDTKANISAWVVQYTVKININKWDYKIFGGMTANVKIIINRQENTIQIPTTYIQNIEWKDYVQNNSWDLIEIVKWISDNNMTQILSWLKVWDQIIKKVSNISKWTLLNDMNEIGNDRMDFDRR